MERKNRIIFMLFLSVLLLAACKSTKTATDTANKANMEQLKSLPALSGGLDAVSAKTNLNLNIGDANFSSAANLKMKRERGVQLSITPLGLFEFARIEFLPQYAQYINKVKKEYSRMDYSNLSILENLGIGYPLLESIFLNHIYIPAGMTLDEVLARATVADNGAAMEISYKIKDIIYKYLVNKETGLIDESVGLYKDGTTVSCFYTDYCQVGQALFPAEIKLLLSNASKSVSLSFSLSRIKENGDFEATLPSAAYKKVAPAGLLKMLSK